MTNYGFHALTISQDIPYFAFSEIFYQSEIIEKNKPDAHILYFLSILEQYPFLKEALSINRDFMLIKNDYALNSATAYMFIIYHCNNSPENIKVLINWLNNEINVFNSKRDIKVYLSEIKKLILDTYNNDYLEKNKIEKNSYENKIVKFQEKLLKYMSNVKSDIPITASSICLKFSYIPKEIRDSGIEDLIRRNKITALVDTRTLKKKTTYSVIK